MAKTRQQIQKEYREKNKDKCKEYSRAYRERHPLNHTEYSYSRYRNNYEAYILKRCKNNAKKKNLDFNLELVDIIIPERCPYLNVNITRELGKGRVMTNASLDRIDSSKGYIKGNVRVISYQANIMKQNVSIEQLIQFSEGVLRLHKYA